jgi:hypothetical protein
MAKTVRCVIIGVEGQEIPLNEYGLVAIAKTPDVSKPHIGKHGLAIIEDYKVTINLDDGNVIYGYECWWMPEDEWEEANANI